MARSQTIAAEVFTVPPYPPLLVSVEAELRPGETGTAYVYSGARYAVVPIEAIDFVIAALTEAKRRLEAEK